MALGNFNSNVYGFNPWNVAYNNNSTTGTGYQMQGGYSVPFGSITNMGQQGSVAQYQGDPNDAKPGAPGLGTAGAIAGFGSLGLGAIQSIAGLNGLDSLGPLPNYTVSPELRNAYNMALGNANQGYSQAERNNFNQGVAQQQNTAQRQAIDTSGGQLSNAINGTLNASRLGAQNQFASQDNQIRRQNQQAYYNQAGDIQAQQNKATDAELEDYRNRQRAYASTLSGGAQNIGGFLNNLGAIGKLLPLIAGI